MIHIHDMFWFRLTHKGWFKCHCGWVGTKRWGL
jgi:hypothetical protein